MSALVLVAVLTACEGPRPTPAEPTTAAAAPTRVPRIVDESDRPHVAFDPCLDLPDDVVAAAGYNPTSRRFSDFPATHYTMLGCQFDGTLHIPGVLDRYGLSVLSANFTFEVEQEKTADYAVPTEFAGRRALLKIDPSRPYSCGMSVETSYGVLMVGRIHFRDSSAPLPESQWCVGLDDTVGRIVAVLDDVESRPR
ncbi:MULTISPECIES: DUF3558 domain-containing protein [Rhodococcus]|uniref:DUF3558 domain-containing protein n=1 Tax=Rhodococcus TaxID=1827 RepID=UPI00081A620F|nr:MULTISPECIES: DUF3558 domain-containing protein [Rhodococcus]ANZ25822.1 hypothetical protein A4U64_14950 [Rhodococcus sp. WB1]QIX53198.1 DUF3558 domain-containing protein [Rhodococcus sp. DMU1]QRI79073.1 DUF3558 domain-containing protein [Rhodococcus aetherivorans]QSE62296.1 DUF3558 domain-containing protein [Rhodococcus sp. PSBB066]QSE71811.1 DUF3558 domain-containing protein [Rhodococcus sp. PSBB049]